MRSVTSRRPVSAMLAGLLFLGGCGARSSLTGTTEAFGDGGHSAGSSGIGGMGGVGAGHGGAGGAALPPGCLPELPGPKLVTIELADRSFCMDATEVTNADYAAWLATGPDTAFQLPSCDWNESFEPWEQVWPFPPEQAGHPVAGVDFCDAEAYCRYASKRLCRAGAAAGGAEEWVTACTRDGEHEHPYGDSFAPHACNGTEHEIGWSVPVGSLSTCEGGYPGLFDLVGNVSEWVDDCEGSGKDDYCAILGGDWWFPSSSSCSMRRGSARDIGGAFMGFRCCRDAE